MLHNAQAACQIGCANQLFSLQKRLFQFKDLIPTLENQTQKQGTLKMRFYIVEYAPQCVGSSLYNQQE